MHMKRIFFIACASALIISCNNKTESANKETTTDSNTEKINYAYLPENHPPDNWIPGDQKNVALVLNSIKGWETGNVDQAVAPFADSVRWSFDGIDQKVSKDTLRAWLTDFWSKTSSVKVKMDDYESVISKDKKNEWVTLWYKQIITSKSGKIDSVAVVDDLKIENGKVVVLDEKQRKYPAPKK
jgi:hypothetical protein